MTRRLKMLPGMRILPLVVIAYLLMPGVIMGKEVNRMTTLTITSRSFTDKGMIPAQFTCDGRDVNPSLEWGTTPTGTRTLALIMDDPDAPVGTWVHWVVWNIPPETRNIKENSVPVGVVQGFNSWKRNAYGGPCPPSGTHRYYFKLYALDTALNLPQTATKGELELVMHGHILAQGEIMGTYRRNK
jgi:Raf kinase inhibitor-like YbhB/YbcL family protein